MSEKTRRWSCYLKNRKPGVLSSSVASAYSLKSKMQVCFEIEIRKGTAAVVVNGIPRRFIRDDHTVPGQLQAKRSICCLPLVTEYACGCNDSATPKGGTALRRSALASLANAFTEASHGKGQYKDRGASRSDIRPRLSLWPQFANSTASTRRHTFTAGFVLRCFGLSVPGGERDPREPCC